MLYSCSILRPIQVLHTLQQHLKLNDVGLQVESGFTLLQLKAVIYCITQQTIMIHSIFRQLVLYSL